ncbi:transcriptional regulator [Pseudomethylobacillus aquaticus]|uniref:Transcriptional regulator n=1 Tax=Pseudomethylobacillus aquaticus TaxID=2676064 RepID=A0A3N0V7C2_9PROT|nr:MucB/RseB C-terminal domain-containing protein [Pseudomethylobacillus aquaticus]ROH88512.1 transcriptional regulator [Pseudomethylobacillus aquaticus]
MRSAAPAYLLALCLVWTTAGHAENQPEDGWSWLQKTAQAARDLSYRGIFVYQGVNTNSKSVQITHMNYGQGEYARIVVLDGAPREILRQGNDVVVFNARDEKVVIEKRKDKNMFPALLPVDMTALKQSYHSKLGATERIGGRDAQLVYLEAKDGYRYSYKLWVDREYGLLLKSMLLNERQEPVEQIAFSQLNLLDTQNMDWFQPKVDVRKPYVMEEVTDQAGLAQAEVWQLGALPAGFHKIDHVVRKLPNKPAPVSQLIFSDGLANVSMFIEAVSNPATPIRLGHRGVGPTNMFVNVSNGYQTVVVGEVPASTLMQISNSISFKSSPLSYKK